jgi:hypothetical protein
MISSMVRQKAGASWADRVQAFWFEELKPPHGSNRTQKLTKSFVLVFLQPTGMSQPILILSLPPHPPTNRLPVPSYLTSFRGTCFEARRLPLQLIISHWPSLARRLTATLITTSIKIAGCFYTCRLSTAKTLPTNSERLSLSAVSMMANFFAMLWPTATSLLDMAGFRTAM